MRRYKIANEVLAHGNPVISFQAKTSLTGLKCKGEIVKVYVTPEQYEAIKQAELLAANWNDDSLLISEVQKIVGIKLIIYTSYEIVIEEERNQSEHT